VVNNCPFEDKELLPDVITKQGNKRQVNPTKIPIICDADLDWIPIPEKPDLIYISKYQKVIGELMLLFVNTYPEITYVLSVFSRYLSKTTPQHGIHVMHSLTITALLLLAILVTLKVVPIILM
jgi:hypothetical protein